MSFDIGSLQAAWVDVPAGTSPFASSGKTPLLSCDSSGAATTIDLDPAPLHAQIQIVKLTGVAPVTPVVVNAGPGTNVESLSDPGASGPSAQLTAVGQIVGWKFDGPSNLWKLFSIGVPAPTIGSYTVVLNTYSPG